jgi:hypothetical protein
MASIGEQRWVSECYDKEYNRVTMGIFDSEHSAAVAYDREIKVLYNSKDHQHNSLNFNDYASSNENKDSDEVSDLNMTPSGELLYKIVMAERAESIERLDMLIPSTSTGKKKNVYICMYIYIYLNIYVYIYIDI